MLWWWHSRNHTLETSCLYFCRGTNFLLKEVCLSTNYHTLYLLAKLFPFSHPCTHCTGDLKALMDEFPCNLVFSFRQLGQRRWQKVFLANELRKPWQWWPGDAWQHSCAPNCLGRQSMAVLCWVTHNLSNLSLNCGDGLRCALYEGRSWAFC